MELLKFKNEAFKLFNIKEAEQLPQAIMKSEFSETLFDEYINMVGDLSTDWLQHLFQYYCADRKEKMQDYTPKCLSKAVAMLANTDTAKVCLDLCAGSGSLTIAAWENNKKLAFVCKEFDERVIPILIFNLAIRNIRAEIIHTDVLSGEVFKCFSVEKGGKYGTVKEIEKQTLQADICISNPPYNMKWEIPAFAQMQSRFFNFAVPPASNANYAFILTALDEIKEKATFILPNAVLSSDIGDEAYIKEQLVEKNIIESVIICPNNMFSDTTIATCLLTINKHKNTACIEFVDLRNKYAEEVREQNGQYGGDSHTKRTYKKTFNILTQEQIIDTLRVINEKENAAEYCKSESIESIRANRYKLTPSQYIDFQEREAYHREYADIVEDINRIVKEKNSCKLTINETLAKAMGFDIDLFKKNSDFESIANVLGVNFVKENYFSTTKNKNEIKFENAEKDIVSSIFMMIFTMWKQHIYFLNTEENRYLAELRDALLPDLMSGKVEI